MADLKPAVEPVVLILSVSGADTVWGNSVPDTASIPGAGIESGAGPPPDPVPLFRNSLN